MKIYDRAEDFPRALWRWPNFTPQEMACKGTGSLAICTLSMDRLQSLRNVMGPLKINSAYRSPSHNRFVGGSKDSLHMRGWAFDVDMRGHDPARFEDQARLHGFTGFGFYPEQNFIHIDTGRAREWGRRWWRDL